MKKKILLIITLLLASCLFIQGVKADNESISLNCDESISPGGTATCKVIANTSDESVTGVRFTTTVSENLTISSINQDAMSCDYNEETGITSCDTSSVVASGSSVAVITVTASDSATEGDEAHVTVSEGSVNSSDENLTATKGWYIGSSSATPSSDSESGNDSENPKTMDTNIVLITGLLVIGLVVVYFGKKKLIKIGK